jgi:cytochrome o ubiquinol oxidase subunit 2
VIRNLAKAFWNLSLPALASALLVGSCGLRSAPVLDPKGPVALAERDLLLTASAVMLIVVVPVIIMAFWFAWRYRASNERARYTPTWTYSGTVDAVVWAVPALIVLMLGVLLWTYTHRLDPYKRIASPEAALEVHVIAQDWKWLFLYPDQRIATVNELVFPARVPLNLKLTSDTVMNSFLIPALGGQIYAMAGMRTELNLLADAPGRFVGRNTQYSGRGFSDQHFEAVATTREDFGEWVEKVRQSPNSLDVEAYGRLAKPGVSQMAMHYSSYTPGLFEDIIRKYSPRAVRTVDATGE